MADYKNSPGTSSMSQKHKLAKVLQCNTQDLKGNFNKNSQPVISINNQEQAFISHNLSVIEHENSSFLKKINAVSTLGEQEEHVHQVQGSPS